MNFFEQVYEIVLKIPRGSVATYGQIAAMLGNPKASRAVGFALHKNPAFGVVPCHRVVNRNGALSSAFLFGGINMQKKLLEDEGVFVSEENTVDLAIYLWNKGGIIDG